jgi:hypothetical protein
MIDLIVFLIVAAVIACTVKDTFLRRWLIVLACLFL